MSQKALQLKAFPSGGNYLSSIINFKYEYMSESELHNAEFEGDPPRCGDVRCVVTLCVLWRNYPTSYEQGLHTNGTINNFYTDMWT